MDDIALELLIETVVTGLMNTKLNQTVRRRMAGLGMLTAALLFPGALPATTSSSSNSWVIQLTPGVTSREVQAALDSLPATGGEVRLPAGSVEVFAPIVLSRDNEILRGTGTDTVLHLADRADCPVLILGQPVNHPHTTLHGLAVADLTVDGNRFHQTRELWRLTGEGSEIRNNGIVVQAVTDSRVTDVTTADCRSGGLVTTLGVRRLTVRGLNSYGNEFDGLACYETTDSVFSDLNLHDNPGAGISLDLAFVHNVVSNAVLARNDLGIFMRASRNNQFHNVTISNSHHFGVFMAQANLFTPAGVRLAPGSECTWNAFTNLAAMDCGSAAFRVNDSSCTNNTLIMPHFVDDPRGGLSEVQPDLVSVR